MHEECERVPPGGHLVTGPGLRVVSRSRLSLQLTYR
jgi:hypothetical protein